MNESIVFVYGTLRKGEDNHHLLADSELVAEECHMEGNLYDTGFGYPAITLVPGNKVYGELYRVSETTLRQLDELEDYYGEEEHNEYWRVVRPVYTNTDTDTNTNTDASEQSAYVYIYLDEQAEGLVPIPLGDWKSYRLLQSNKPAAK